MNKYLKGKMLCNGLKYSIAIVYRGHPAPSRKQKRLYKKFVQHLPTISENQFRVPLQKTGHACSKRDKSLLLSKGKHAQRHWLQSAQCWHEL